MSKDFSALNDLESDALVKVVGRCIHRDGWLRKPARGWRAKLVELYDMVVRDHVDVKAFHGDKCGAIRWVADEFDISEAAAMTQLVLAGRLPLAMLRDTRAALSLPHEVLVQVFKRVPSRTLMRCCLVSKDFSAAATDDAAWAVRPAQDDALGEKLVRWSLTVQIMSDTKEADQTIPLKAFSKSYQREVDKLVHSVDFRGDCLRMDDIDDVRVQVMQGAPVEVGTRIYERFFGTDEDPLTASRCIRATFCVSIWVNGRAEQLVERLEETDLVMVTGSIFFATELSSTPPAVVATCSVQDLEQDSEQDSDQDSDQGSDQQIDAVAAGAADAYQPPQDGGLLKTHRERTLATVALHELCCEQNRVACILLEELSLDGVQTLATALQTSCRAPGPPARLHLRRKAALALADLVEADTIKLLESALLAAIHRQCPALDHNLDEEPSRWRRWGEGPWMLEPTQRDGEMEGYPTVGSRDVHFAAASRDSLDRLAVDRPFIAHLLERASVAFDTELAITTRLARRAGITRFTGQAAARAWHVAVEHATALLLRSCVVLRASHLDDKQLAIQALPQSEDNDDEGEDDGGEDDESDEGDMEDGLSEEDDGDETDGDDVEEGDDPDVRWDEEASEWVILPSVKCIADAAVWVHQATSAQQPPRLYRADRQPRVPGLVTKMDRSQPGAGPGFA